MSMEEIEATLVSFLGHYGARKIGVFGSYARGEQRPDSDLDVLVDFRDCKSLLTLVRIERELSEALGVKVDLLTEKAISPYLIDRIKAELKVIYQ
ncbi:MAG TPA: nucleotidyltransferase family protein [Geobacteraceae bacterium]|nr:nucleotidyltransferase family protein [Geobacteraceae bacterium]